MPVRLIAVTISIACSFALVASVEAANPEMDQILLKDGGEVRGEIVKRDDRGVWIDVGPTVVRFDLDQVEEIVEADADAATCGARARWRCALGSAPRAPATSTPAPQIQTPAFGL